MQRHLRLYIGFWAVGLFVGTLVFALIASALPWNAFKSFGEFGDFVGGVANPMLALLGFLALLYTIQLQLNELSLSRDELILTRGELKRSASALERQNANLDRQRLSQAFFDLFEMYRSVVSTIETGHEEHRKTGKAAIESYASRYVPHQFSGRSAWSVDDIKAIHVSQNDELGSYFRMIFRIFSFLAQEGEAGEFFADIFRAQLTTSELHLLLYNCISDAGQPMEKFAAHFELFDNMPVPNGANFEVIMKDIDPKCLGQNLTLIEMHLLWPENK